jgi:hypothetical protein
MAISTTFQGLVPRPGSNVKKPLLINQGLVQRPGSQTPPNAMTTINQGFVQRPGSQGTVNVNPVNTSAAPQPTSSVPALRLPSNMQASGNVPLSTANTPKVPNVTEPSPAPTNEQDCLKAGGRWVDGVCQLYQKAPEYVPPPNTPTQATPQAASSVLHNQQQASNPIAQAVANTFTSQVQGMGDKMYKLAEMDINKAQEDATLRQLQNDAAKGMAFSTSNLDAQNDIIRDASIRRMTARSEADAKQAELDMQAAEQAKQMNIYAAQGQLAPGGIGSFTPGAITPSSFMSPGPNLGLGALPALAELPTSFPGVDVSAATSTDDEPHTDTAGHKCKLGETDADGRCPSNPDFVPEFQKD